MAKAKEAAPKKPSVTLSTLQPSAGSTQSRKRLGRGLRIFACGAFY